MIGIYRAIYPDTDRQSGQELVNSLQLYGQIETPSSSSDNSSLSHLSHTSNSSHIIPCPRILPIARDPLESHRRHGLTLFPSKLEAGMGHARMVANVLAGETDHRVKLCERRVMHSP